MIMITLILELSKMKKVIMWSLVNMLKHVKVITQQVEPFIVFLTEVNKSLSYRQTIDDSKHLFLFSWGKDGEKTHQLYILYHNLVCTVTFSQVDFQDIQHLIKCMFNTLWPYSHPQGVAYRGVYRNS